MQQDDVEIFTQARNELLKSVLSQSDFDYEREQYLLAESNLLHKGIEVEYDIFTPYLEMVLKSLTIEDFHEFEEGQPLNEAPASKPKKKMRIRDKTATRRIGLERAKHRLTGRFSHGNDFNIMHSKWPELTSRAPGNEIERIEQQSQTDNHPWSKDVHPLLMKHPGTGYPAFIEMLRDYYLPDDEGNSPARSWGESERAHEIDYKDNPVISGVGKEGDKKHLFLGPLSEGKNGASHEHELYERAFETWKQKNMSTVDSITRQGGTDRDVREAHFDDAAKLWSGQNDIFEQTFDEIKMPNYDERKKIRQQLKQAGVKEEDIQAYMDDMYEGEDTEKLSIKHPHKLGWLGYHMGLEWLDPTERTKVIEHLAENSSTDPDEYNVKLSDGHEVPLSRFKRNMMMRAAPELNWIVGQSHRSIPNMHRHKETMEDLAYGSKAFLNALDSVQDPSHGTLKDKLLTDINERLGLFEGESETLKRLPIYGPENRKKIKRLMKKSPVQEGKEPLLYALRALEDELGRKKPDNTLTVQDFYDFIDTEKSHPISELLKAHKDNPYLEDSELNDLKEVMTESQDISPIIDDIGNALTPFNSTIGPTKNNLTDREKRHYIESNGIHLGGQSHWSRPYMRGNLGLSDSTHLEALFALLGQIGDDKNSLMGTMEPSGYHMNRGLMGLLAPITRHHKDVGQGYAYTANHILTPFDRTQGTYKGQKANHAQHSMTPGLTKRLEHELDDEKKKDISNLVSRHSDENQHNGITSDWGKHVGASRSQISDTHVAANASNHYRPILSKGGFHVVGSRDGTGKVTLGPSKRMFSFDEVVAGLSPMHPNIESMEELIELAYTGNLASAPIEDYGESEILLQDMDQLEDEIYNLEDSIRSEYEKERPIPSVLSSLESRRMQLRDQLKEYKNSILQMKAKSIRQDYSKVHNFSSGRTSEPDVRKMNDMLAIEKIAKEVIIPGYVEKDPDAFNPEVVGVSQFLINTSAALHDAEIMSLHMSHDSHGATTLADGISEKQKVATDKDKQRYRPIFNYIRMNDNLPVIDQDTEPDELLSDLGLPIDEEHLRMAQEAIDSGATKVTTLSSFVNSGMNDGHAESYMNVGESHDDIVSHMLSETVGDRFSWPEARRHPLHIELQGLNNLLKLDTKGLMESLGMRYHQMEKEGSVSAKGSGREPRLYERQRAKSQRLLSQLISFDAGVLPPDAIKDAFAQEEVFNLMSIQGMETPIDSILSVNGATPNLYYSSSGLAYHHGSMTGTPTVRAFADMDGNPQFGRETERMNLLPVSEETLLSLHGQQTFDTAQQMAQTAGGVDFERSSTNFDVNTGQLGENDLVDVSKALPSEMPLIEPYHKVFEYGDIEELRGFTGEWAVSVMEEGTRVKVTRKGTYVSVKDDENESVSISSEMSKCLRKLGKRNYVVDAVKNSDGIHIFDIMEYDGTDVTDMDVRERMKLLRGQFDSRENVFIPGPSTLRITDEDGLEEAIKFIQSENKDKKILLRDAKSTYMRGEEKHPKWVLMTKSDDEFHIPFGMEIDEDMFILHFDHDILKYDIVDDRVENPRSALSSLKERDYTLVLAKSLESYWMPAFDEMLKAYVKKKTSDTDDSDKSDWDEESANEGMTDERARRIDNQSGGVLKPKKDPNILLKPKMVKAIELIERALDALEKAGSGHYPMSGGKGLGIDVGSDISSPRGPTTLNNEATLPDYDMKERPEQDPEKPEDYPKRKRKSKEHSSVS